jgi:hypothetical protein
VLYAQAAPSIGEHARRGEESDHVQVDIAAARRYIGHALDVCINDECVFEPGSRSIKSVLHQVERLLRTKPHWFADVQILVLCTKVELMVRFQGQPAHLYCTIQHDELVRMHREAVDKRLIKRI